ncbi:hypothetical protein ACQR16_19970 [Bradyrhizobium oligotrophicum]|uniref:hypothetical protein n=1 Tax=Bradyrhizobium oligotrophicum TaxID=44255 RepID=UPI003EB8887A
MFVAFIEGAYSRMTFSEITFSLFTTLLGAGAGAGVSLYFFRAQQITDFNRLFERLRNFDREIELQRHEQRKVVEGLIAVDRDFGSMSKDIASIKVATDAKSVLDIHTSLDNLKISYSKLNSEVERLSGSIIDSLRTQQDVFLSRIQNEFSRTVEDSKGSLERSLAKELAPLVPSTREQAAITKKLIELTSYAMMSMGKYQLEAVKSYAEKALDESGQKVGESMQGIQNDARQVKEKLDKFPLTLPGPSRATKRIK